MNKLLKSLAFSALAILLSFGTNAQTFGDILNRGKEIVNNNTNNSGSGITNQEAISGLKQALEIGTKNASGQLSKMNGYFGNQLIKIVLPPEAQKVEAALRQVGMGHLVDKAILSMNRAAEDAATKAVPIFVDAITGMTVQDGIGIIRGGNGAATNYLKGRTTAQLTNAFRPVIQNSLDKVDATKYWKQVFTTYNNLPTTFNKVNPDLAGYVTERALNGLFVTIAQEENKIRQNPSARVTDLLKKVFGNR